jgi:hypothetical protein
MTCDSATLYAFGDISNLPASAIWVTGNFTDPP